jgi:hypothetical protein
MGPATLRWILQRLDSKTFRCITKQTILLNVDII